MPKRTETELDELTDREIKNLMAKAKRRLDAIAAKTSGRLKVGRTTRRGFSSLRHRDMYAGAEHIHEVVETHRDLADLIEKCLINHLHANYSDRHRNEAWGGGGVGEHESHVVYVVVWPHVVSSAFRSFLGIKPESKRRR